ncbi:hypothetical protein GA0070609_1424 [Micromonospora echinaurantiaca]|uniref:Uncharacterized protein n=1 Tax=Micromonospora echinaurantiaca TaxID=47857 RepID=A0A1C5HEZ2_9ACTN|nr:hypothetical protein GA0070609_1424 [Micromonospora echinaurantiaca]
MRHRRGGRSGPWSRARCAVWWHGRRCWGGRRRDGLRGDLGGRRNGGACRRNRRRRTAVGQRWRSGEGWAWRNRCDRSARLVGWGRRRDRNGRGRRNRSGWTACLLGRWDRGGRRLHGARRGQRSRCRRTARLLDRWRRRGGRSDAVRVCRRGRRRGCGVGRRRTTSGMVTVRGRVGCGYPRPGGVRGRGRGGERWTRDVRGGVGGRGGVTGRHRGRRGQRRSGRRPGGWCLRRVSGDRRADRRLVGGGDGGHGHGRPAERRAGPTAGGSGRFRGGSGLAEVLLCRAYGRVVGTEHGGPGGGDPDVVAARFVPIAQFVRYSGQLERERQHQRLGVRPAALARGERLLQHPAGGARVVRLTVQPGQQVRCVEHIRVVFAVRRSGGPDGLGEHPAGGGQIASGAQRESPLLDDGQGSGMGHVAMLPVDGGRTLPGARPSHPRRHRLIPAELGVKGRGGRGGSRCA